MRNINEMYFVKSETLSWGHGFSAGTNKETGISVTVTDTSVEITHHFGPAPTWQDVLEVLRYEDIIGDIINVAKDSIEKDGVDGVGSKWRVEHQIRPSGAEEIRLRVKDEVTTRYGTGGKVVCHLHISCAGKLNEGLPIMKHTQFLAVLNELFGTKHDSKSSDYVYRGSVRRAPKYEGAWNKAGNMG